MKGFSTKAVHGIRHGGEETEIHGALRIPVYDNVAFEYETSRDIQLAFEGKKQGYSYSRTTNPTVDDFEQRIRLLADAHSVVALSSGMAAIANVVLTLGEAGSNIVTSRCLFGNTLSLFDTTLKAWGLETRYVDMTDADAVAQAIDKKTMAIFLEVISNPQLEVADIGNISQMAGSHNVPVILDGTLTTPYIFASKDHGVHIEVISNTKYISGGATAVGGLVIDYGTFNWKHCPKLSVDADQYGPFTFIRKLRREVFRNLGACLSPHSAYLHALGLETLELRIDRSCANALEIAQFLEGHPGVVSTNYPGLTSSPYHGIAQAEFGDKYGGILTFQLKDREQCFTFMDRMTLIRRATNINDNKTLILHPSSTIFSEYSDAEKKEMNVSDTLLRLSVGIEDVVDIIDDLKQGFEGL
ncbi:MAG: PLP-dependent transferase, partial [Desulfobacterales bacterium]